MIPNQKDENFRENWTDGFLPMDKVRHKVDGGEETVNSAHYQVPGVGKGFSVCGKPWDQIYAQADFELVHRCIYRPYASNVARCKCGAIYTTAADTWRAPKDRTVQ